MAAMMTSPKTLEQVLFEEGARPDLTVGERIGNAYALSVLQNPRRYENLSDSSRRGRLYKAFKELIAKFDYKKYVADTVATSFADEFEKAVPLKVRPAVRTTFSKLVARLIHLVQKFHCDEMGKNRAQKKTEQRANQRQAWNKQSIKREALKQKMGTEAFNAKKHRDKAASALRKAEEVKSNFSFTEKFLQYRATPEGKQYDYRPVGAALQYPRHSDRNLSPLKRRHLGLTSSQILCDFVKKHWKNVENMQLSFVVDAGDITTIMFQYVATVRDGILRLSNTNDFNVVGKKFKVTAYYENNGELFVNLDNKQISFYRQLPKKWASFERWVGYGIEGNPQHTTAARSLVKVKSTNLYGCSFVKNKTKYIIGHSFKSPCTLDKIEAGIVDKFAAAVTAAAAASAEHKRHRAAAAREAERRRRQRAPTLSSGGVFDMFFGVGTKQEDSTSKAKANLAQKLASGEIDMKTFNAAMGAL